jgi:hypothetical protein
MLFFYFCIFSCFFSGHLFFFSRLVERPLHLDVPASASAYSSASPSTLLLSTPATNPSSTAANLASTPNYALVASSRANQASAPNPTKVLSSSSSPSFTSAASVAPARSAASATLFPGFTQLILLTRYFKWIF